jgi:hypothetical protein
MKILTGLTITVALAMPLLAQTPTRIPSEAEVQAKQELNEAARAYREGNFAEAQAHSERALLLDPQKRVSHAKTQRRKDAKKTIVTRQRFASLRLCVRKPLYTARSKVH